MRVFVQGDALGQDLHVHRIAQPAGAADDGAAIHRRQQMPDQPRRNPFIIKDREGPGRRLDRARPRHRALARQQADFFGRGHVTGPDPPLARVVAFHLQPGTADRRAAKPVLTAAVTAFETIAQRQPAFAFGIAGAGAFHRADARNRQRRRLGGEGAVFQRFRIGFRAGIEQFQRRAVKVTRQLVRISQPKAVIDRGAARHRHRPAGHGLNGFQAVIGTRDIGLPPADQHPQADLDPLGAFGMFQPPAPHIYAGRRGPQRQRLGLVCTGVARGLQHRVDQGFQHGGPCKKGPRSRTRS